MSEEGFVALFPVTLCLPTVGPGGGPRDRDTILGLSRIYLGKQGMPWFQAVRW